MTAATIDPLIDRMTLPRGVRVSGVYAIRNRANGRLYVGGTSNIRARWMQHASLLRQGKHPLTELQQEWSIDESLFEIVVLEELDQPQRATGRKAIFEAEQRWQRYYARAGAALYNCNIAKPPKPPASHQPQLHLTSNEVGVADGITRSERGKPMLTVREVAAMFRISQETVRRWARSNTLPSVMPGGTKLGHRFRREDVEQFIERSWTTTKDEDAPE